jgi:hypothetical protein
VWLNVPSLPAKAWYNPLNIGPITYAIPAAGATTTGSLSIVLEPSSVYVATFYVVLQADATTPVIFDQTIDWCEVQVGGDVLAADVPPYPPYYPNLKSDLLFTNYGAGPSYEANSTVAIVFETAATPGPTVSLNATFANVSGTMSWASASGGNTMVSASLLQLR